MFYNFEYLLPIWMTISAILAVDANIAHSKNLQSHSYRNIIFPTENFEKCGRMLQDNCKLISACPEVLQNWMQQKIEPETCYFQGSQQYVCCPNNKQQTATKPNKIQQRRSEMACQNFFNNDAYFSNITFLRIKRAINSSMEQEQTPEVVHGEKTLADEFPYMAALGWKTANLSMDFRCGGVLVAPNFVLTSAHCTDIDGESLHIVRIGGNNLKDVFAQQIEIKQIFVHPSYNHMDAYNDIALLELQINSTFMPACLWSKATTPQNTVTAIGYGNTKFAGTSSVDLLKADLNLVANEDCQKYYPSHLLSRLLPQGLVATQICAGDPEHKRDTCQGDSGGPIIMLIEEDSYMLSYVVGITTMGQGCTGVPPSVYTRSNAYIDWIENIVWAM